MKRQRIEIENGTLDIGVIRERMSLHNLLGFASRENPKRGFLFVSKVLGKHIPVTPSVMRMTYDLLASQIENDASTFVVGMAETAVGLGAGFADSLAKAQNKKVYYQHTTRYKCNRQIWFTLDESHSHAVDHICYLPESELLNYIVNCERLILVDDEISTGRTLKLLGDQIIAKMKHVKEVIIVSLVNWLDEEKRTHYKQWQIPVQYVSLLDGTFEFQARSDLNIALPKNVDKDLTNKPYRDDLGRFAIEMPFNGQVPLLDITQPRTVIGDGEHLYLPFLAAESAEKRGGNIVFQSTTRSPIMLGNEINTKESFRIDLRDIEHYIYNLQDSQRLPVVFLEDEPSRTEHQLAKRFPVSEGEKLQ
ncbi:phosphoribosyltransferase domain-containing protein [Vibrio zhanjiangensis]|uniref:phosphoribosyltransferase domain-containing protein n=1 Tax=Vibrio zhanjiangensis TaxID=1046128 RepID=UPI0024E07CAE|nr:phosphoribosyltransferase domain-containing protein [Vibrio zhanjiangensis]